MSAQHLEHDPCVCPALSKLQACGQLGIQIQFVQLEEPVGAGGSSAANIGQQEAISAGPATGIEGGCSRPGYDTCGAAGDQQKGHGGDGPEEGGADAGSFAAAVTAIKGVSYMRLTAGALACWYPSRVCRSEPLLVALMFSQKQQGCAWCLLRFSISTLGLALVIMCIMFAIAQ